MLIIPNSWISLMLVLSNSLLWLSFAYTFTVTNNCPYTIWPGTLAGAGTLQLPTTGFRLDAGQSASIPATVGWSGRIWARTGCQFDGFGMGKCQTGDCAGRLECSGMGATPPTSLFEITLGAGDMKDFYDVSLVDGYNIPLVAAPQGFSGECNATGCVSDINMGCPKELQVVDGGDGGSLEGTSGGGGGGGGGGVVACKSACGAFGLAEYCCSGEFANPTTCRPSFYSTIFKRACPTAYSYAFDDGTSTFTCKAFDYAIIFCPSFPGNGGSNGSTAPAPPTLVQNQAPPTLVQNQTPPTSIQNQCNNGKIADMVSTSVKIQLPNLFLSSTILIIFIALNLFV